MYYESGLHRFWPWEDFTHTPWRTQRRKVTDEMVTHTHLDGWFPAPAASCIDVKGHEFGGRCHPYTEHNSGEVRGKRREEDAARRKAAQDDNKGEPWVAGRTEKRDWEAPGEDLFLWADGDSASSRRGRRLGQCRAEIQPPWRARGLPAPKRDTLNHLLLVPDAECLLKPGWRGKRVKWRTASLAVAFIKVSVCVWGVERGAVNWETQWRLWQGRKLEMFFFLKPLILHLRVVSITSSPRCYCCVAAVFPPYFLHESHKSLCAFHPSHWSRRAASHLVEHISSGASLETLLNQNICGEIFVWVSAQLFEA